MGLLAKGGDNFDDEYKQVSVNTELLVCPTCGREVPPWVVVCPDDGTPVLAHKEIGAQGPAVPAHLLDGLDLDGPGLDGPGLDASGDADPDGADSETDVDTDLDEDVEWPA